LLNAHCQAHLEQDLHSCVPTGGLMERLPSTAIRFMLDKRLGSQTTLASWTDPRIAVAVAAVPFAAGIDMHSLAPPRIPVGLVRAGRDEWLAPQWHIDAVRAACGNRCTLIADMPAAGHGSILSPQPPGALLPASVARLLGDPPDFDRASLSAVHDAIARFFIRNLLP
jgi:hypothetical protein